MSENKDGYEKNEAGILVPPQRPAAHVERAEFAVKVRGFAPEKVEAGKSVKETDDNDH